MDIQCWCRAFVGPEAGGVCKNAEIEVGDQAII